MSFATPIILSLLAVFAGYILGAKPVVYWSYGLVNPALMLLLYAASRHREMRRYCSASWLKLTSGVLTIIILLNAPGSVYLHDLGVQYDRFLHFTAAFVALLLLLILLTPLSARRHGTESLDRKKLLQMTFLLLFLGLFLWEGLQWSIDQLFGTRLFFDSTQPIAIDATEDILFGFVGMLLGAVYVVKSKSFWPTLRRSVSLKEERARVKGRP